MKSSCRRRILKALIAKKEVSMMKMVRITNSTFNEVDRNLRILEEAGFVTQRRTKQKRIISLNAENEKTSTMLETLRVLEAANGA